MLRPAVFFLLLGAAIPAPAAVVADLYAAEVPVAGRDDAERAQALAQALRVVLVKVTGDRGAAQRPAAAALVRDAARYVQQYQYVAAPPAAPGAAAPAAGLLLRVVFGQAGLDAALAPTGLPVWGRERPAALLWLAVDDGTGPVFVGAGDPSPLAPAARRRAGQRGIPLVLPRLDAGEVTRLGDGGSAALAAASAPYATPAVATARLRATGPGAWEAAWTLATAGTESAFTTRGELPEAALADGIDALADALAARYAAPLAAAGAERVEIVVTGVAGVADYARAQRYLAGLDIAADVQTAGVAADRVAFALQVRGGAQALARTVALGSVLAAVPEAAGTYRLQP